MGKKRAEIIKKKSPIAQGSPFSKKVLRRRPAGPTTLRRHSKDIKICHWDFLPRTRRFLEESIKVVKKQIKIHGVNKKVMVPPY
jgi:hypothetical protein